MASPYDDVAIALGNFRISYPKCLTDLSIIRFVDEINGREVIQ
jgi:hypothetical protein